MIWLIILTVSIKISFQNSVFVLLRSLNLWHLWCSTSTQSLCSIFLLQCNWYKAWGNHFQVIATKIIFHKKYSSLKDKNMHISFLNSPNSGRETVGDFLLEPQPSGHYPSEADIRSLLNFLPSGRVENDLIIAWVCIFKNGAAKMEWQWWDERS